MDFTSKQPPAFGHAMKEYFLLDPDYVHLNSAHGTTPKPVLEAVHRMNYQIEQSSDRFHRGYFQPRLVSVRQQLADFVNAKLNEVVLVTNASLGIDVVLRNFEWENGDIIFQFTTTYDSVMGTIKLLSDAPPHPSVVTVPLLFPTTHAEIISTYQTFLEQHPAQPNKKRVVIIDSIASSPGVYLPWKELVKISKERGVYTVIDAAHSVGQELNIDLTAVGPDFWISNCHKWLSAKRPCAMLYVPERNQHIIKSSLPTSHLYVSPKKRTSPNFVEQFEWSSTTDVVPFLTIPIALEFRKWVGGEEKINAYCHGLAMRGGQRVAEIWKTRVMDPDGESTLNMVNVELPLPSTIPHSKEVDLFIKGKLLREHGAYAAFFIHNNIWWSRMSAQIFNELSDFEKFAEAFLQICDEVKAEFDTDGKSANWDMARLEKLFYQ